MLKIILSLFFVLVLYNQIILAQINLPQELKAGKKILLKKIVDIGVWSGNEQKMFFKINDVKTDKFGNIYILDSGNHRIQKFNHLGKYISSIGHEGQGPGEFLNPISMIIDNKDNIYVLDKSLRRVTKFDKEGNYLNSIQINSQNSHDLVDNYDNLIVLESGKDDILRKYSQNGELTNSFCNVKIYNIAPEQKYVGKTDLEKRFYKDSKYSAYSTGALSTYLDLIYLTFRFPYKILVFSNEGIFIKEFTKNVTYPIKLPEFSAKEKGSKGPGRIIETRIDLGTSFGIDICVTQNMIFNLVASPQNLNGDESKKIDVFDLVSSDFLSQIDLPHFTRKIFIDEKLNIFCVVEGVNQDTKVPDEIPPQVIKYGISFIH